MSSVEESIAFVLDSSRAASEVMAQFGILQVRHPARGRRLPSHLPAGARVRHVNLKSTTDRDLAGSVLAHLRRVAGWVTRYHTFQPEAAMGIAAPQLGIPYRIAIVSEPHSRRFIELINPSVIAATDELADEYEGCLCFFDVRGIVRRPVGITIAYDRLHGEPSTTEFTGAMARSLLHEIDHLDGKLYTDRDRMPAGMNPIPVDEYRAQEYRAQRGRRGLHWH